MDYSKKIYSFFKKVFKNIISNIVYMTKDLKINKFDNEKRIIQTDCSEEDLINKKYYENMKEEELKKNIYRNHNDLMEKVFDPMMSQLEKAYNGENSKDKLEIIENLQEEIIKTTDKYFKIMNGKFYSIIENKFYLTDRDIKLDFFGRLEIKINNKIVFDLFNIWKHRRNIMRYYEVMVSDEEKLEKLEKDQMNLFSGIKAKNNKKFDDYDEKTKNAVLFFIEEYMKSVLCSDVNKQIIFLLQLIKYTIVYGKKADIYCILYTAIEGSGKSTFTQFIMYHVIGLLSSIEYNGLSILANKFNASMYGKLFVVFEEGTSQNSIDYITASNTIKKLTTSHNYEIEYKGVDPITKTNINGYWMNTNNMSILKGVGNSRRSVFFDVSSKRAMKNEENNKFWTYLYNNCFNDKVGEAFYSYLRDYVKVDKDWQPQNNIFHSFNQEQELSKQLENNRVINYIRNNYLLKKKSIDSVKTPFLREIQAFYGRKISQSQIETDIHSMGIIPIRNKKRDRDEYKCNYEEQKKLSIEFKWALSDDKYRSNELLEEEEKEEIEFNELDNSTPIIDYESKYNQMKEINEDLIKKINNFENKLNIDELKLNFENNIKTLQEILNKKYIKKENEGDKEIIDIINIEDFIN